MATSKFTLTRTNIKIGRENGPNGPLAAKERSETAGTMQLSLLKGNLKWMEPSKGRKERGKEGERMKKKEN